MSRDPAPWCHLSARKGRALRTVGGLSLAVNRVSVCVHASLKPTQLSRPPYPAFLPPGIKTRELDLLFVILKTETEIPFFLSLCCSLSVDSFPAESRSSVRFSGCSKQSISRQQSGFQRVDLIILLYFVKTEQGGDTKNVLQIKGVQGLCSIFFLTGVPRLLPCFWRGGK